VLTPFNLAYLLEKTSAEYPSKIAIEDSNENKLTYDELNIASKGIDNLLLKHHIGFGNRVGVLASKSCNVITFIFGILRREAAYISLDCKAPVIRNCIIYKDCGLQALFIEKQLLNDFVNELGNDTSYNKIDVDNSYSLLVFNSKEQKHTEQLAYIIYTSGSSGTPKGVKHTHHSAFTFINWAKTNFSPDKSDRFLSYAPFHFDLSIFDIFTSISVGATLVLADDRIVANPMLFAQYLSKKNISILYATPSALSYMVSHGKMEKNTYPNLKLILFAGEVFSINQLKNLKDKLPETEFHNLYGPTETNVCTWFKIPDVITDDRSEPYPIGKVCNYAKYKIVKEGDMNKGELLIAGDSLMSGYWNDADKTNSAIEVDSDGKLWYHTGDIVMLNDDNDLVYLCRKDRMVKRNGYRVELNEIEQNLLSNKNILETAVTAKSTNSQTDTIITAHIVWAENNKLLALDLLNYCHTVLPAYMIPDNFEFYEQLPKTSTHKIDYKQLTLL
jgi:amino acid adenylation domain-containing protein